MLPRRRHKCLEVQTSLDWTRSVMTRLGLILNEAKTSIKTARKESFHFLGYTFGPHRYKPDGHCYLGPSPSKKCRQRIKQKVGDLLIPVNVGEWEEVRGSLNQILRGWSAYFSYGSRTTVYREVNNYVSDRVRHFLKRRHKVQSRGTEHYGYQRMFGETQSTSAWPAPANCVSLAVKSVGKPDARNGHVRFDERR
jgi:RNA-directed DNA polymerase